MNCLTITTAVALALAAPPSQAREKPNGAPKAPAWRVPEAVRKVYEILAFPDARQAPPSPLKESKSRLGWDWLAAQHGLAADAKIKRADFRGTRALFDRLDRDGDGVLHKGDFDWSDDAPFVKQQKLVEALFNRLNTGGNGHMSEKEWKNQYDDLAGKKGYVTSEDLQKMIFPPGGGQRPGFTMPTRWMRLMGLLTGELGSVREGPNPGQVAPPFSLSTVDGKTTVALSDFKGKRPVVLAFGNFT